MHRNNIVWDAGKNNGSCLSGSVVSVVVQRDAAEPGHQSESGHESDQSL